MDYGWFIHFISFHLYYLLFKGMYLDFFKMKNNNSSKKKKKKKKSCYDHDVVVINLD